MKKREKAAALNQSAIEAQDQGQRQKAVRLYKAAAACDPSWGTPLYNLGLLYKRQRRWRASLKYNRLATQRDAEYEAAWWNLGIAATALGRWRTAREAWRGFGLPIPNGRGPIDFPCGFGPVRLHADDDGSGEVVWAYRLDPARAELASIPFPESGYRWRDIVLNDGAPRGYRQYKGEEVPVLDALQLLKTSPFGTYIASVRMPNKRKCVVELARLASELDGSAEDWSTSVKIICRKCSEGRQHSDHDTEAAPPPDVHLIGIAAHSREHATQILHTWEADRDDVEVESLDDALEPGANNSVENN